MPKLSVRSLLLASLVASSAWMTAGCYADASVEPAGPVVVAGGYEPQYYDGSVVYYDDGGRPFYYMNGGVVWIPSSSPYYGVYVDHWRGHRDAYVRWHSSYGARYRNYHAAGHRGNARPVYRSQPHRR